MGNKGLASADGTGLSSSTAPVVAALRASIPDADVQRFSGEFMVFRLKNGKHLHKRVGGKFMPFYRHMTLDSAEAEATRLNALHPDCTFLIMQGVSRVKASAQGIAARSDETPQEVRPERQEPGPEGAP